MTAEDVQRVFSTLPHCARTVFRGQDTRFIRSGQTSTLGRYDSSFSKCSAGARHPAAAAAFARSDRTGWPARIG